MAGITRIHIESDWKPERITKFARPLEPTADELYKSIFGLINMPIVEETEIIKCTKDEALARYDYQEGIDCIFHFANGHKATNQEKFLEYHEFTATFTEQQKNGVPGAWYTCTAQYYFVGYANKFRTEGIKEFQAWILLDFPAIKRADALGEIPWQFNGNNDPKYDGIYFRYVPFAEIPEYCIVMDWKKYRKLIGGNQ